MTIITASENKKGGVGRTTTAINLGTILASVYGERVLLIDWDADRCLTDGLAGGAFDAHAANRLNILDCMADSKNGFDSAVVPFPIARYTEAAHHMATLIDVPWQSGGSVDIITGSEDLSEAPERFTTIRQPVATFEQSLHWMLRQPDVTDRWDRVILDIGPGWDITAKTALFAADEAIIPVEPASLSIEAFKRHNLRISRGNTERKRAGLPGQTVIKGVFVSRISLASPVHQHFAAGIRQMLASGNIRCFDTMIPTSDAILAAMSNHAPAWGQYPDDEGAQAYAHLAKEVKAS